MKYEIENASGFIYLINLLAKEFVKENVIYNQSQYIFMEVMKCLSKKDKILRKVTNENNSPEKTTFWASPKKYPSTYTLYPICR